MQQRVEVVLELIRHYRQRAEDEAAELLQKAEMERMLDNMKDLVHSSAGGKNIRKILNLGS